MTRMCARTAGVVGLWLFACATTLPAQVDRSAARGNAAIGAVLFQTRCADCHGIDGKGVLGPDLTTLWADGASDDRVFRTIRQGVPGTEMPSSTAPDGEVQAIVAYLHTLDNPEPSSVRNGARAGDVEHGALVFDARCVSCHRVDGQGGRLGPDLSRVGLRRPRAFLEKKIRTPATAAVAPGYQAVTLVLADGRRLQGTRKNEDAFSIQIMTVQEQLVAYPKSRVQAVLTEPRSLMPAFAPDRLPEADLSDLLAYLMSRRQSGPGR
jgi:putative heme-binding domain-containing protein